jgi:transketolase
VGEKGEIIGMHSFGDSAPGEIVLREHGFTVEHICERALALIKRNQAKST